MLSEQVFFQSFTFFTFYVQRFFVEKCNFAIKDNT